ncbi:MAG: hypothetical protein AB7G35_08035 [Hyphomicrobiaceae bacterium]
MARVDLFYLWIHETDGDRALVSEWDAEPEWISTSGYQVRPDLDIDGTPIKRRIATGAVATYCRFERIASEAAE